MGAQNLRFTFRPTATNWTNLRFFSAMERGKRSGSERGWSITTSSSGRVTPTNLLQAVLPSVGCSFGSRRVVTPIISSRKSNSDGSSSRSEGNPWCVYRCIRKHIVVSMLGSLNIDPATELLLQNEIWHSPVYQRCRMTVDAESAADAAA